MCSIATKLSLTLLSILRSTHLSTSISPASPWPTSPMESLSKSVERTTVDVLTLTRSLECHSSSFSPDGSIGFDSLLWVNFDFDNEYLHSTSKVAQQCLRCLSTDISLFHRLTKRVLLINEANWEMEIKFWRSTINVWQVESKPSISSTDLVEFSFKFFDFKWDLSTCRWHTHLLNVVSSLMFLVQSWSSLSYPIPTVDGGR